MQIRKKNNFKGNTKSYLMLRINQMIIIQMPQHEITDAVLHAQTIKKNSARNS